jgi:hypothetical protein
MQNLDHNIDFWEKRHFFAENWEKSQKIVIITSTPDRREGIFILAIFCLVGVKEMAYLSSEDLGQIRSWTSGSSWGREPGRRTEPRPTRSRTCRPRWPSRRGRGAGASSGAAVSPDRLRGARRCRRTWPSSRRRGGSCRRTRWPRPKVDFIDQFRPEFTDKNFRVNTRVTRCVCEKIAQNIAQGIFVNSNA